MQDGFLGENNYLKYTNTHNFHYNQQNVVEKHLILLCILRKIFKKESELFTQRYTVQNLGILIKSEDDMEWISFRT